MLVSRQNMPVQTPDPHYPDTALSERTYRFKLTNFPQISRTETQTT
jgi:hypothetical protein